MFEHRVITTTAAPAAIGPYSQANRGRWMDLRVWTDSPDP